MPMAAPWAWRWTARARCWEPTTWATWSGAWCGPNDVCVGARPFVAVVRMTATGPQQTILRLAGLGPCARHATLRKNPVQKFRNPESAPMSFAATHSSVAVDAFTAPTPLVNLSELLAGQAGVVATDRGNYAQDLQIAVRG